MFSARNYDGSSDNHERADLATLRSATSKLKYSSSLSARRTAEGWIVTTTTLGAQANETFSNVGAKLKASGS